MIRDDTGKYPHKLVTCRLPLWQVFARGAAKGAALPLKLLLSRCAAGQPATMLADIIMVRAWCSSAVG